MDRIPREPMQLGLFGRTKKVKPTQERKVDMNAVEMKVLNMALAQLQAIKCAYKIITPAQKELVHDPDGVLEKKVRKNPRRLNRPYNHGDLSKHYIPFVEKLAVGEVAKVPYTDSIPCAALQSSLCAWMSKRWGNSSYTTLKNNQEKVLEVLRVL